MCPTEGRDEECVDSHNWIPSILGHPRFKQALKSRRLPARTIKEMDAMKFRAKLKRDDQGKGKSNDLVIGSKTKHSRRHNGNGGSILSEMSEGIPSWADAAQKEADLQKEMDIDDNARS